MVSPVKILVINPNSNEPFTQVLQNLVKPLQYEGQRKAKARARAVTGIFEASVTTAMTIAGAS
ncbi:unnamed protein product [Parascedosporium putredinis]|uniref:Uncharacterized protein n=1 Tax=Parascedosporium putredinis TaxID=1442378 RepID=A0A9P1GZT0_9PEZI|nr:unnamed protein product [Parascedosporium putredinis]CAI7991375.1 unnamed protein product [Parascedosporium putredinis]